MENVLENVLENETEKEIANEIANEIMNEIINKLESGSIFDMESIKADLERDGYVVIPDVLNKEELNEYIDEFCKWLYRVKNLELLHQYIDFHGIFKHHEVGHQRFAWLMRTNPKIIGIFKELWDTDELVTSFDGCCYYPKDYIGEPSYWTHTDQSSMKKGRHCLQSFVSLTENSERTMIVYRGSHKLHEEYFKEYEIENLSNWNIIKEEYIERLEDTKEYLEIKQGSMVIWDSRTFHQNTCGTPTCCEERLVQYLCYLPKHHELNNEEMQNQRMHYFNTKRTTSHWPYPISAVPKQPNTYNHYFNDNIYIEYESLPRPVLDDLMDKIHDLL